MASLLPAARQCALAPCEHAVVAVRASATVASPSIRAYDLRGGSCMTLSFPTRQFRAANVLMTVTPREPVISH
jgi:hypothetical protein